MEYELQKIGDTSTYRVANYDQQLESAKKYCAEMLMKIPKEIITAEDRKTVKAARAEINKQIALLKDTRLGLEKQVLGEFQEEMKTIESELKSAESVMKAIVDADKSKNQTPKPEMFYLIVASLDEEVINKVMKYAVRQGCKAERK